jgi:PAS domain S-box-containing protein
VSERAPADRGGHRLTIGFLGLMLVLGAGLVVLPGAGALNWALIGLVSVAAVGFGARRHAAPRPVAWWLLAAAILAMAAGDTLYGIAAHHGPDAAPALADICYMAMFPLLIAGLVQMVRTNAGMPDWARWLDVLTFTCAAALVAWAFLLAPDLAAGDLTGAEKSFLAVYIVGDLLILVIAVRLAVAARRGGALLLVALGAAAVLAGDVLYTLDQLGTGWRPGGLTDLAYWLFYAAWGAAALHPSMARLTTPAPLRPGGLELRRAVLLAVSLAIPPAVLVVEAVSGAVPDGIVIAAVSALMSALIITRLANALTQYHRAVAREQALRQVSGRLVSSVSRGEVSLAVRQAVGTLVPRGQPHAAVIAVYDLDEETPLDPVAGLIRRYPLPTAAERGTRLLSSNTLHPELRDHLGGFPTALSCPMVDPREPRDPGLGALLVAAEHRVLVAIQDSVEVLAAQATLALERIALTEVITRLDSDRYLRAVTHNTLDVVLIVDDDLHIRYASPSLAGHLGVDTPLFATLSEVVHPDDHSQIPRTLDASHRSTQPEGARDWWKLQAAGGPITVEVNCRDLRQDRIVRGYVITMRDITERDGRQREFIQQALQDSPGGLNRHSLRNKFR